MDTVTLKFTRMGCRLGQPKQHCKGKKAKRASSWIQGSLSAESSGWAEGDSGAWNRGSARDHPHKEGQLVPTKSGDSTQVEGDSE